MYGNTWGPFHGSNTGETAEFDVTNDIVYAIGQMTEGFPGSVDQIAFDQNDGKM